MKPLNEEQAKVIKDFEQFKESLIKKYTILRMGMSIMEKAFNDALKEQKIDNKPSAYGMISYLDYDLRHRYSLEIDKDSMLVIGILKEPVNKETAIKECLNFIIGISIHITELENYLEQSDRVNLDIDLDDCKQHINKVINVIFEISE